MGGRPVIRVVILGSTGSIGESTLRVIERHRDRFRVVALAARRSVEAVAGQVRRTGAQRAVITESGALERAGKLPRCQWSTGEDALLELARDPEVDVVVNALVGSVGLGATLAALLAGKRLALANKESLVSGGPLVLAAAAQGGGQLVPIDSEHSAILQCLEGCRHESVARLVLTASGGPFREWNAEEMGRARPAEALRHPTWRMGAKVTVDSATLANKALEVIEAHFLYGVPYDAIEVVVHPQSIVHSFVEFVDGSVLAQLGLPNMELPILYALGYPDRIPDRALRTFDPMSVSPLTFEGIDRARFPLFSLGVGAGRRGGTAPAIFNAANEVVVEGFLSGRLSFPAMAEVVAEVLCAADPAVVRAVETVADVLEADAWARRAAGEAMEARGEMESPRC
ncbi:MAG: 1-deoxy-D-xylulose-5-phosphate reductoisomerase [Gemmatimonadetes bacterium]|nr:1-deoxy-D-xylulose-5-phosphate reductoisomerase [Gemmatimonadota bacterium]